MTIYLKPYSDLLALATGNHSHLGISWHAKQTTPTRGVKNVLITGANGFIGLHLVKELLSSEEISQVFAFVRSNTDEQASKRLFTAARRFGLKIENQDKLKVYGASFSCKKTSSLMDHLSDKIDSIIHAAGSTNHIRSYLFYRKETVLPLFTLMRFSQSGREKSLHIIGSIGADIYAQYQDFFKLNFYYCGYSFMKLITKHITRIANEHGFPITMYLPSYVIGSSCTDYRDPGMRYAFWQMLRMCNELKMIWDSGNDVIPVMTGESLSKQIVSNILEGSNKPCLYPSSYTTTKDIANRFQWDYVPWSSFYNALRNRYPLFKLGKSISVRSWVISRALFPCDLPKIIHLTNRFIDKTELSSDSTANVADSIFLCAEQSYLFNRKTGVLYDRDDS